MKRVIKDSMRGILVKLLIDFSAEEKKDSKTIMHYVDQFVKNFDRYLGAYNDFKDYEED